MSISRPSSLDISMAHLHVLQLIDELQDPGNEERLAYTAMLIFPETSIFRSLPEQKRVVEFLLSAQRLEKGFPLTTEERNQILEQCRFVQPLIGELSAATHASEGREDDDD